MPPHHRIGVEAVAVAMGWTHQEVVEACAHAWLDAMQDPAFRAAARAMNESREAPYGLDPL